MMKGNKGEWSEVYVFLKLLADGVLNAADANLNAISDVYYPIIKILRQEGVEKREFIIDKNIQIIDGNSQTLIISLPISEFVSKSQQLFKELKAATGRSNSFPAIEAFLNKIDVKSLKALKTDKADIRVVVHDLNTGLKPTLGFSIKSILGKNSTLFNPAAGTNFIYKITPPIGLNFDVQKHNSETLYLANLSKDSKISIRLTELENLKCKVSFHQIQSEKLNLNLELIDSQLPEILAYLVYHKYNSGISKIKNLIEGLNLSNPLRFDMSYGHPFYEYKIKNFLTESALGMTPEAIWTGKYDATGGIIIVKKDGDVVCYHIYNRNEFQSYLLNNTKLEQPETSEDKANPGFPEPPSANPKPYKYGWVYEENGELFIKLNLQVRFI